MLRSGRRTHSGAAAGFCRGVPRMEGKLTRRLLLAVLAATASGTAQEPQIPFVCPMDPDVRSPVPAKCPRCGMKLVAGIPDPHEFAVDLQVLPRVPRPGQPI